MSFFSFIPGITILSFLTTHVYPLWKTGLVLHDWDVAEVSIWLFYWCFFAVFQAFENYLLWAFVDWIPVYPEGRWLVFLWLLHPDSFGLGVAWTVFQDNYAQHDAGIQRKIATVMGTTLPDTQETLGAKSAEMKKVD